jgi:hypothetical protein
VVFLCVSAPLRQNRGTTFSPSSACHPGSSSDRPSPAG